MTTDLPVIDISEALSRSMGDTDFLKMMLDEFQRMIPDFISRMEQSIQRNDMRTLAKDAHQFKGTAANLGAKTIAAAALELEQIGKSGDPEPSRPAFSKLQDAVGIFTQHLAQIEWSDISGN
jgi:two-component system sensor histidine kinase/response regulator